MIESNRTQTMQATILRRVARALLVPVAALTLLIGLGSPAFASTPPGFQCGEPEQQYQVPVTLQQRIQWRVRSCTLLQTTTSSQHALSPGSVPVVSPR